jgi:hypothetical protein
MMISDKLISIWQQPGELRLQRLLLLLRDSRMQFITHPLGFVQSKWVENRIEFRLNIWSEKLAKRKEPDWQLHNHSFSFESYVIVGALEETRYSRTDRISHSNYSVKYDASGSSLTPMSQKSALIADSRFIYSAGDKYEIESVEIHSTRALTDPAVTLMQIGERTGLAPIVFGDLEPAPESIYRSKVVGLREIMAVLKNDP